MTEMADAPVKPLIDPFICSTDEFCGERNLLSQKIYPILNATALERGASFRPYDWDISLSEDQLGQGLALNLALDYIQHSTPFFIALIGEDYGEHRPTTAAPLVLENEHDITTSTISSLERNLLISAANGHDWILAPNYSSTSLFELKIVQAAFRSDDTSKCRFYVKDTSSESRKSRNQETNTEADFQAFKLKQLRITLAKRGLFVTYYKTTQQLCQLFIDDWLKIIDQLYPSKDTSRLGSSLFLDEMAHVSYANERQENFIEFPAAQKCMAQLGDFVCQTNTYSYDPFARSKTFDRPSGINLLRKERESIRSDYHGSRRLSVCLLNGSRGCGKSALVSRWLSETAPIILSSKVKVISHFTACQRSSRNVAVFMKRVIIEMREAFIESYDDRMVVQDEYQNFQELREEFLAALHYGPCVIVLDGLDEIAGCMDKSLVQMKRMAWIPQILPPACKIIFTVNSSDLTFKSLSKRQDVFIVNCPSLVENADKISVWQSYLALHKRSVPPPVNEQITAYKLSSSPLFHLMIAHELADYHVNRSVMEHIDLYADTSSISTSTRSMWSSLIKRWIKDYSWDRFGDEAESTVSDHVADVLIQGWIPDVLRLLACSRDGLYPEEILHILEDRLGYSGKRRVAMFNWNLFYNAAKTAFYEKPNGLIVIGHEHFMEVIDYILLGNISPPAQDRPSTMKPSGRRPRMGKSERSNYHLAIASHLLKKPAAEQLHRLDEILAQLEIIGDYKRISTLITVPHVLLMMNGPSHHSYYPRRYELLRLWKMLDKEGCSVTGKIDLQLYKHGILETKQDGVLDDNILMDILIQTRPNSSRSALSSVTPPPASQTSLSKTNFIIQQSDQQFKRQNHHHLQPDVTVITLPSINVTVDREDEFDESKHPGVQSEPPTDESGQPKSLVPEDLNYYSLSDLMGNTRFLEETVNLLSVTVLELSLYALHSSQILIKSRVVDQGKLILQMLNLWLQKQFPLAPPVQKVLVYVHMKIAELHRESNENKKCLEQLYKANEVVLDMPSVGFYSNVKSLLRGKLRLDMAAACTKLSEMELAQSFLDEAKVLTSGLKSQSLLQRTNYHLAYLRAAQKDYVKAIHHLKRSTEYFELWFGPLHPLVAEGCYRLGIIFSDDANPNRNYGAAGTYLNKALNINTELSLTSLKTTDIYFKLASIIQKGGLKTQMKDAISYLQQCVDIRMQLLGNHHEKVKQAIFFINDLERSLRLGQFEFGSSKPADNRSKKLPFSRLSMHDEALNKIKSSNQQSSAVMAEGRRPVSAYSINKPRKESRLNQALVKRPSTAPSPTRQQSLQTEAHKAPRAKVTINENMKIEAMATGDGYNEDGINSETGRASPELDVPSKLPTRSHSESYKAQIQSLLKQKGNKDIAAQDPNASRISSTECRGSHRKSVQPHRCGVQWNKHSLVYSQHKTTVGPSSNLQSIYKRPPRMSIETPHLSAWYHTPSHYASSDKPHVNLKTLAQRKKRLMRHRNENTPLKSNYLTVSQHNAIDLIAQQEMSYLV